MGELLLHIAWWTTLICFFSFLVVCVLMIMRKEKQQYAFFGAWAIFSLFLFLCVQTIKDERAYKRYENSLPSDKTQILKKAIFQEFIGNFKCTTKDGKAYKVESYKEMIIGI